MKKILFISLLTLSVNLIFGQRVLLEEYPNNDTIEDTWGQNLKHFGHLYLDWGFAASGSEEGAEVLYGSSYNFDFGYRYKRRFCNTYALGADLGMSFYSYRLKQDKETKKLPDNVEHTKERFKLTGIKLELYQRINFGKRGNHIGTYWDLGVFGNYFFNSQHYAMDKDPEEYPFLKKIETIESRPNYLEDFEYGVSTRIGKGRWVMFGRYRLNDLFKKDEFQQETPTLEKYPELPALQVGFEISLF